MSPETVHAAHALNLLPCYVRLLQIFELSEYFGTLLFTVFGMAQDTSHFLVLLGINSLGFSCSLTPILYPNAASRWDKGVSWGFWAIFGDVDLDTTTENHPMLMRMCVGFLQYMLSLTSNVLLVNLLIAMLNDTYIANKDASKREWAFNRVDAVLEFSSPEAHILPPPFDLFVSIQTLRGYSHPVSRKDQERYARITKVAATGAQTVQITVEVFGGEKTEAQSSSVIIEDKETEPACDVDATDECHNKYTLTYENVLLLKPIQFRYGSKTAGYQAVRVTLDEDTWLGELKRIEKRAVLHLQQRVIADLDAKDEKEDEKEALVSEFEQKLSICTEEIERLRKQVADVTTKRDAAEADHKKQLEELGAKVDLLTSLITKDKLTNGSAADSDCAS